MQADPATLVRLARAPDAPREARVEAFSELVHRFQDLAYGCAYAVLGNAALAEEVAQEAFVTARQRLGQLRQPSAFAGWLRRIVISHCRRLTRCEHLQVVPLDHAADAVNPADGPLDAAARRSAEEGLLSLIGLLPEHERTVTILHYVCGYTQADVAACLDVTESAVAKRLWSARRHLRAHAAEAITHALRGRRPSRDRTFERLVRSRMRPFEDTDRSSLTVLAHLHHPGGADECRFWLRDRCAADPNGRLRRQYVVERSGSREILAFGAIEQSIYRPRYRLFLVSDPRWLHDGAGELLLDRLEGDLHSAGAITVSLTDYVSRSELQLFLEQRGYEAVDRVRDLRLTIDATSVEAGNRLRVPEVEISTLRELRERDPGCIEKLHVLITRVKQDDPAQAGIALSAFNLREALLWLERPYVLPDAYFVAMHRDEYVGVSDLHLRGAAPGQLVHGFIGVLPEYRRRGIGRALTQAGIRYAQRHGYETIRALIRPVQTDGLALSEAMGFRPRFSQVTLEKCLRRTIALDPGSAEACAGEYQVAEPRPDLRLRVSCEHGRLFVEFNGQKPELFREAERTFFVKWFYGRFEFVCEAGRPADGLIWQTQDRNGKDAERLCATRIP